MRCETSCQVAGCRRMRTDKQRTSSTSVAADSRTWAGHELPVMVLVWLVLLLAGCATGPRPDYPRTASATSEQCDDDRRSVTVVPTWAAVDSTGSWHFTLRIWASKARTATAARSEAEPSVGQVRRLTPRHGGWYRPRVVT